MQVCTVAPKCHLWCATFVVVLSLPQVAQGFHSRYKLYRKQTISTTNPARNNGCNKPLHEHPTRRRNPSSMQTIQHVLSKQPASTYQVFERNVKSHSQRKLIQIHKQIVVATIRLCYGLQKWQLPSQTYSKIQKIQKSVRVQKRLLNLICLDWHVW